jgi:hypothetical protein
MKEAILVVYRDTGAAPMRWRSNIIDNKNGLSVARTPWVPNRRQALLDGMSDALDRGYKVWVGGAAQRL